jgi:hypothetical protein
MIEFLKQNWQIILPIIISIISAIWTAYIGSRQKKLENKLSRSIAAYDIILKKEFEYYQETDAILADLIVHINDIESSVLNDYPLELPREKRCELGKASMLFFLESIPKLKNLSLKYEVYLPQHIRDTGNSVVITMQENMIILKDSLQLLFENIEQSIEKEKCNKATSSVLLSIAAARSAIIVRLKELTKI